ncbi:MAG: prepilin-type N-terminal cleavage/methylation domain-containing protein [Minisyncoccia bacterium]
MKVKVKNKKGFSLVELLVGVAVFSVICVSVYDAYKSIFDVVYTSRAKLTATDLANEQLEIIRNAPYSEVGISGGIPSGIFSHTQTLVRGGNSFDVTTTIRNTDDPFDGTLGGNPNDSSPADFKVVEVEINCMACRNYKPVVVTTRVAPKNLETASTNGALFVKVFDANGNPVSDANVHIVNNQVSPPIIIDDVTNVNGMLQIVDAPPGVNAYDITVTKNGYSTDKTYAPTGGNPNPVKPLATVALQQVTQLSFTIDKLSSFYITSVTQTCTPVGSIDFNLQGSKLIGTTPNVLKYDQDKVTSSGGALTVGSLEWDSYLLTLEDGAYDLIGWSPISPVNLIPNSNQSIQLVVAPKNPKTLLITVTDSATSLPLSGVDVTISKSGFTPITNTTGQGFLNQTDWSGGSGQATTTDVTQYFSSDGNIENISPVGDITLKKVFGDFVTSGVLTSSSFDVGSPSNFQKIQWNPIDQPVGAGTPNVRLQIATNNNAGTWNFTGPDGTSGTYYTVGDQNINTINDSNQFFRYKVFLDTNSTSTAPNLSNISFTFTSLCTPPGQVLFDGLPTGTYNIHLSRTGYVDQDVSIDVNSNWQSLDVILLPN